MTTNENFYILIDQLHYNECLQFLVHNQTEVSLKIENHHVKSRILKKKSPQEFAIYKFDFKTHISEKVICSFELSTERYFFRSTISNLRDELLLIIPDQIFKLQRRNDFRVAVPQSMAYQCEITNVDGQSRKFKVDVRDISLGGMQIQAKVSHPDSFQNSTVHIKLSINEHEWERIQCVVKRAVTNEKDGKTLMGLMFLDTSAQFLTDLQSLLVQLDRIHRGKSFE